MGGGPWGRPPLISRCLPSPAAASALYGYSIKELHHKATGSESPSLTEDPLWALTIDGPSHRVPLFRYLQPPHTCLGLPALGGGTTIVEGQRSPNDHRGLLRNSWGEQEEAEGTPELSSAAAGAWAQGAAPPSQGAPGNSWVLVLLRNFGAGLGQLVPGQVS